MSTTDLDHIIEHYREYNEKARYYQKKAETYKTRLKKMIVASEGRVVETPNWRARLSVFQRTLLTKKNVPDDIWKRYATVTQQEKLVIQKPTTSQRRPNKKT